MVLEEFGGRLIVIEPHVSSTDPMSTPETEARADWYGVSGIPDVRIGGKAKASGATTCEQAAGVYRPIIQSQLTENSGLSPVAITGDFSISDGVATLEATYRLVDPVPLPDIQATLFLYEGDVTWCCGYGGEDTWQETVRMIWNEPVVFDEVGDTRTVARSIPIGSWNPDNLHAVAILQQTGGSLPVVQAARLPAEVDYSVTMPRFVDSAPSGEGVCVFDGSFWNLADAQDLFTLSTTPPAGWTVEFQIEGDPQWYTNTEVNLAGGESRGVSVRVSTDAVRRADTALFTVRSSQSGRLQEIRLRIFNGAPAVLFVDDDNGSSYGGTPYSQPFHQGFGEAGYLYDTWDADADHGGGTPGLSDLLGYDLVIWATAYVYTRPVTDTDMFVLKNYLDSGGRLYLAGTEILTQAVPGDFFANYLGVESWTNNTGADYVTGIPNDPLSDGLLLDMTWPVPQANKVDRVDPTTEGRTILVSDGGNSSAVRYERGAFRTVFSTLEHLFMDSDPDPNNSAAFLARICTWLLGSDPTAIGDPPQAIASGILRVSPSPFGVQTEISFGLPGSAARAPAEVLVLDAAGRRVRSLHSGVAEAGLQRVVWDGKDDQGAPVASGIYFVRLKGKDCAGVAKVVAIR